MVGDLSDLRRIEMAGLEEVVEGQFGRRLLLDRLDGKFGCLGVVGQLGIDDLLYALVRTVSRKEGLIASIIGRICRRTLLRLTSATRLELSVT